MTTTTTVTTTTASATAANILGTGFLSLLKSEQPLFDKLERHYRIEAGRGDMSSHNHHRRGPWSQAEDNLLMSLVQNQGALNWVRIAQILGCRTPKQCRERYHQNLKPTLNHDPITPEEGIQIERLVREIGKRWAEIARRLNGRSDNAVKNWWNGSQNRRKRHERRRPSHLSALSTSLYEERTEAARYARAASMEVPRTLSLHHPLIRGGVPPPLSPGYHSRAYGVETPLPSPCALSPGADSTDLTPSLMSDTGSCYTTSPRTSAASGSPIELPPLKNLGGCASTRPCLESSTVLPSTTATTTLPPMRAMVTSPPALEYRYAGASAQPIGSHHNHHHQSQSQYQPRHYPYHHQQYCQDYPSPRTHLPTAPNSPVGAGQPPVQMGIRCMEAPAEKDSRMDVAALLG